MRKQQQRTETVQQQQLTLTAAAQPQINLTKNQIIAMSAMLATSVGVDALAHFDPAIIAAGIFATAIAGKATPLVETLLSAFVPTNPALADEAAEKIAQIISHDEEEYADLPQDFLSKMKRLLHIQSGETGDNDPDSDKLAQPKEADGRVLPPAKPGAKSTMRIPDKFELDEVLELIKKVNKKGYVYFGEGGINKDACIHLAEMYHVFDVSSSGKGKSNRFRLGMMQVVNTCETYYINPFANNIKVVKDSRKIEVWTPIYERLANGRPVKEGPEIAQLMNALVDEIQTRSDLEDSEDFTWADNPIFVFIDELPETFKRCPDAVEMLDTIVRTGRQFCVFTWVASQSAAVTDIGQSTASQAQYKTRIYGGGDRNSSGRMMKGSVPPEDEETLQTTAGLTLMLADGLTKRQFVRAPLVTNEALFEYFGLEFDINDWLPSTTKTGSAKRGNLLQLAPLPEKKAPVQAQNDNLSEVKVKGKRVKGPHEDAILDAIEALESEEKLLTLNAIAKRANLTRHQYEEIEDTAIACGYELALGKGRPAKG